MNGTDCIEVRPGIVARVRARLSVWGQRASRIYFAIFGFLATPFTWLLRKVVPIDERMKARAQRAWLISKPFLWLWRLPVRAARGLVELIEHVILYGLLWIIGLLLLGLFVGVPLIHTEWVGGVFFGCLLAWLVLRQNERWYWRATGNIGGSVAIAVVPQFVFLLLYNGLPDLGIAPPSPLEAVIKLYEYGAVQLNAVLQPIGEVAWYWWVGAATILVLVAFVLEAPSIVDHVLWLRRALSALVFAAGITGAVGFSALLPTGSWQPDVQARLQAHLKEQSFYESTITVSQELTRWFQSDRRRVTALPAYVRSFEEAVREVSAGSRDVKAEDIRRGTQKAARGLVPADAAGIAVGDVGAAHTPTAHLPGRVDELLAYDAELRRSNLEIKASAARARATAVNTIVQIVNVQVSSQPMLREILGEMINTTAENISRRIVERLPIERGMAMVRKSADAAHKSVAANSDKLAEALFAGHGPVPAEGMHSHFAIKAVVAQEIARASAARVRAEVRGRSFRVRR
jgi:hypothetical protein